MFHHIHPYEPFNLQRATKLIVGTLPPPRFTTGDLKAGDVNFSYGSIDGQLWPILDSIFDLDLDFEDTYEAIRQRKDFLIARGIGVCDIVASAKRDKVDASDLGMQEIELRDIFGYLTRYTQVDTLLFTGGNSKNGPEYFFRKAARDKDVILETLSRDVPRQYQFNWAGRMVKTVSLTAPSGAANRAVGAIPLYKKMKAADASFTTIKFRELQYAPFF